MSEVVRVCLIEKLTSKQRLVIHGGVSHVGMRRRIPSRGSSLYKDPKTGEFLDKGKRPKWLQEVGEAGTRRR